MMKRETTLTLKGIAIIFVMLGHLITKKIILFPGNLYSLRDFATYAVDIFLILSGYGLYYSYKEKGLDNFFKRRISKILLPYSMVTLINIYLHYYILHKKISFVDGIKNIIGIDLRFSLDGTMWFIAYIYICYIIFYLVFSLKIKEGIKISIMILFSYIFYCFPEIISIKSFFRQAVSMHAMSFSFGILLYYYMNILNGKKIKKAKIGIAIISLIIFCVFHTLTITKGRVHIYLNIAGISLFIFFFIILENINKVKTSILKKIGELSFEMYLIEGLFLIRGYKILYILKNGILNLVLFFFLVMILSKNLKRIVNCIEKYELKKNKL